MFRGGICNMLNLLVIEIEFLSRKNEMSTLRIQIYIRERGEILCLEE